MAKIPLFTGTDEHGLKVYQSASDAGVSPRLWCDQVSRKFREMPGALNIPVHRFVRTTDEDHKLKVQSIWEVLRKNGDIYSGSHSGWYCVADECFYGEHEIEEVGGGKVSKLSKRPVQWINEQNYMFKLSKYRQKILEWLKESVIIPGSRVNDILSFLNQEDCRDISVSRTVTSTKWGIPVRGDNTQMIYVWFDALINYLTALGDSANSRAVPDVQILGKDILKFHCIMWPAILMSLKLPLPKKLIVHGHWTVDGVKMSKSLGNVIDPHLLIKMVGVDSLRYYLLKESRLDCDGSINEVELIKTHNSDLVNQVGNLYSRCFNHKITSGLKGKTSSMSISDHVISDSKIIIDCFLENMEYYNFHVAVDAAQRLMLKANRYFSEEAPWKLVKEGREGEVAQVLLNVSYFLAVYAKLMSPIMPSLCGAINRLLSSFTSIDAGEEPLNEGLRQLSQLKLQYHPKCEDAELKNIRLLERIIL